MSNDAYIKVEPWDEGYGFERFSSLSHLFSTEMSIVIQKELEARLLQMAKAIRMDFAGHFDDHDELSMNLFLDYEGDEQFDNDIIAKFSIKEAILSSVKFGGYSHEDHQFLISNLEKLLNDVKEIEIAK